MKQSELSDILARSPVIAAVRDEGFDAACVSPCEVIFYLKANINTIRRRTSDAHER